MFRRRGLMIAALAIAAILGCYGILSAQVGEGANGPEMTYFAKKFVVVTSKESAELLMKDPQVRRIGTKIFLVGEHAGDGSKDNPYQGAIGWVPLEKVTRLLEFETIEAARKAYASAQPVH